MEKDSFTGWWESRTARMVLVAVILFIVGLIAHFLCPEGIHPKLCRAIVLVGDALLVISITVLFTEAGPFKSYMEERVGKLTEFINKPVMERMKDVSFLRQNQSVEYIRELRRASTHALLPKNIKKYPEFLSVIDNVVLPLAEQTIWRRNYSLTVVHSIITVNHRTIIKEKTTFWRNTAFFIFRGSCPPNLLIQ